MTQRRALLVCLAALVAVALGWIGLWVWSAGQLETAVARFAEQQRARGLEISYQGPEVGGFPFGLTAGFATPLVSGREGWRWAGPAVSGQAKVWSPFTIETAFAGRHRIAYRVDPELPEAEIEAEAAEASGWAELRRDGRVEQAAFDLGALRVQPPAGGPASAERLAGRFGPSRTGAAGFGTEIDLAVEADGVVLPDEIKTPLGQRIEMAGLDATLVGEIPPGKPEQALAAWRDAGGSLEVRRLSTVWGSLQLEAAGTAGLDREFRPIGAFEARIGGLVETLDALARAGVIESGVLLAARFAVAALGGEQGIVEVPITLRDGRLYLGPVPLVRLSPVL